MCLLRKFKCNRFDFVVSWMRWIIYYYKMDMSLNVQYTTNLLMLTWNDSFLFCALRCFELTVGKILWSFLNIFLFMTGTKLLHPQHFTNQPNHGWSDLHQLLCFLRLLKPSELLHLQTLNVLIVYVLFYGDSVEYDMNCTA